MEESSLKKFHRRHRCGDGYVCYDGALKEMQGGRKHTSWMWWIFPQVAGLGRSHLAKKYAIQSLQEVVDFLEDPVLGAHYCEITEVVMKQICREGVSLPHLFRKEIDVRKFISSITLFQWVALKHQTLPAATTQPACSDDESGYSIDAPPMNYPAFLSFCAEIMAIAEQQGFKPCEKTLDWIAERNNQK